MGLGAPARTLTLPDYRCGRVLFAGDAAHLLPIFGVRGANTAFQDAQSPRLDSGLRGQGPGGAQRRWPTTAAPSAWAQREIIHEAGKSARFMTPLLTPRASSCRATPCSRSRSRRPSPCGRCTGYRAGT
jgi:2-polyprenyl-6-methoxyphenol hydroxylase-like FAD-dependent oxidoreductase